MPRPMRRLRPPRGRRRRVPGRRNPCLDASPAPSAGGSAPSRVRAFGPGSPLSGFELPFEPLRKARAALAGQMIDLMLTAVAGAVGTWHRESGHGDVSEGMTL